MFEPQLYKFNQQQQQLVARMVYICMYVCLSVYSSGILTTKIKSSTFTVVKATNDNIKPHQQQQS